METVFNSYAHFVFRINTASKPEDLSLIHRTLLSEAPHLSLDEHAILHSAIERKIGLLTDFEAGSISISEFNTRLRLIASLLKFGPCKIIPAPFAYKVLSLYYYNKVRQPAYYY